MSTKVGLRSWIHQTAHRRGRGLTLSYAYPRIFLSTDTTSAPVGGGGTQCNKPAKAEGWFFLDSVFPIRLGIWDLRYYIAVLQEETLIAKIMPFFKEIDVHGFEVDNVESRRKDGGVFIHFRYRPVTSSESINSPKPASGAPDPALVDIGQTLHERIAAKGGLPSWLGLKRGTLWRVRGKPWREDMRRYASPILRVAFEGPDVGDERIWDILRPYGRIRDLTSPIPVPAGTLRSTVVTFERIASATIAHNCVHGAYVLSSETNSGALTRLSTTYERPLKPHVIRDWLASHPRIVLPVVVFLLGTLTYTIFDPIRTIAVQAKLMDWFDYREFAVTKWLRRNAFDRLYGDFSTSAGNESEAVTNLTIWKDRQEAESSLENYLTDYPSTVMFMHGPAGSGKSQLLRSILETADRRAVVIDCNDIYAGSSDSAMVKSLAEQTGYRPTFTFLNSVYQLVDLASVGLIGQKAGLSSSLEAQVSQVLEVVAQGLRRFSAARRQEAKDRILSAQEEERRAISHAKRSERIRCGVWHDGRIDFVAGNIFSELGMGIERFGANDEDPPRGRDKDVEVLAMQEPSEKALREYRNAQDVGSLPVVVIKNFASKAGKEEVYNALADWAAVLVSGQVAHVIVVSDNRENAKRLAKALSTKPMGIVALADADPSSSLSYIYQKLREGGVGYEISSDDKLLIERVGGRATDLQTIIHKVQAGQSVGEAVEELIQRGVAEMRKNAFGDDVEDAKGLMWTRQQAWTVLKLLAQQDELPYQYILLDIPFKSDESALRAMEHAEIISITYVDGRPSTIRPGKPIQRYVFQRILADKVFQATQDIAYNELLISGADSTIKSAEAELSTLKDIISGSWSSSAWINKINLRTRYLTNKLYDALKKMERLEEENVRLRKVLAQGDDVKLDAQQKKSWWGW